jgi:glutamine amidotransferase
MIKVIDYGLGNVSAILNVYKRLNIQASVATNAQDLQSAEKIILPGVGAFDSAMSRFNHSGMREVAQVLVIEKKIPILGICVGMQILADSSQEGDLEGLGWIPGEVIKFSSQVRCPHMGWNNIKPRSANPILKDLDEEASFYFLHSYYFKTLNESDIISTSNYNGEFASMIHSKNIYGAQFHPEKSHKYGSLLLKNFAEL